jgi:hypothetical protein
VHSYPARSPGKEAIHHRIVVTMSQTFVAVAAPGIYTALGEQPPVHLLPAITVMLDDWLVGYSESTTRGEAPVRRVESNRWLLEALAGAAECKEALCVEVWEDEHKYVEGEV